tara:strand:- start:35 stop:490 length:456 start_codon:yes stop_codon:yes gene_type:complete
MALEDKINTIDFYSNWKINDLMNKNLNWLNFKKNTHKVVQVYVDNSPFLRIGQFINSDSPTYHIQILRDFLEECNSKGEMLIDNCFERYKLIPLNGERYDVVGMGMVACIGEEIHFFGSSHDYEISTDLTHFNTIKEKLYSYSFNENFTKD